MIKLVLFDGNGVIYYKENDASRLFNELAEKSGFKKVKKVFNKIKPEARKGVLTRTELFNRTLKTIGLNEDPARIEQAYNKQRNTVLKTMPGVKKVLKQLKKKELKIGMLSDGVYNGEEKKKWLKKLGVSKYFDYVFTSRDLGYTKIYPECIQEVLKRTKCKINEVLLIGHELKDFIGAKIIGVKTASISERVKGTHQLKNINDALRLINES